MKQFSPFLIEKGLRFVGKLLLNQDLLITNRTDRTLVASRYGEKAAIYITPRD